MKSFLTITALTAFTLSGLAQSNDGDRKVSIDITINENGETKRIKKDFQLNEGRSVEDALRELGVLEEFDGLNSDESLEIDIRRHSAEDMLRDMHMSMFWNDEAPCDEAEKRAFLGVYLEDRTDAKGVGVTDVIEGTAAEKAGLKANDVITSIDGKAVNTTKELIAALKEKEPNDEVKVAYLRDGKKQNKKVVLGEKEVKKKRIHSFGDGNSWIDEKGSDEHDVFMFSPSSSRAFLGVEGSQVQNGVQLDRVIDGSSAQQIGLLKGDVITHINDEHTSSFTELAEIIGDMEPGDEVQIQLIREGINNTLNGELGQRNEMRWNQEFDNEEGFDMPDMPDFENMFTEEDREMLRNEMKEFREEMRELRDELRGTITREMRIVISRSRLNEEEKELLGSNGVEGLENELGLDAFQCSPNPSNGNYALSFTPPKGDGDISVDVYNSKGERVRQEKLSGLDGPYQGSVDLTQQSNGTYFLVISQGGRAFTEKLVKQ